MEGTTNNFRGGLYFQKANQLNCKYYFSLEKKKTVLALLQVRGEEETQPRLTNTINLDKL